MCGIFAILFDEPEGPADMAQAITAFGKSAHRGPDSSRMEHIEGCARKPKLLFGFHRLRINGLSPASDQPLRVKHTTLICNGEIYNTKELQAKHGIRCITESDCEIVGHLYLKLGLQAALEELDGVFAFLLYDHETQRLHAARDLLGIRPLFYSTFGRLSFASEAKSLLHSREVKQFAPGTWQTWDLNGEETGKGRFWSRVVLAPTAHAIKDEDKTLETLRGLLHAAVRKRLVLTDRPVGCLLSGGLDSTLVTAIVVKERARLLGPDAPPVHTYSIGMEGSPDLKWAREAADHLGTCHHEIVLGEGDFLRAVSDTVWHIESYDITSVRASVGNLLVSRYVRDHSDDTVIFVGDVADELFASYRGFSQAPDPGAFDRANRDMLFNIHRFDVLRSDRTISGAGLEARVPFGDIDLMQFVLGLPAGCKMFGGGVIEKLLLRRAFEGYLPKPLLYRRKEAFSDGVAGLRRGWHEILKEHADGIYSDAEFGRKVAACGLDLPDKESLWYYDLYRSHGFAEACSTEPPFGNQGFWRHPFCGKDADPSARTLECY